VRSTLLPWSNSGAWSAIGGFHGFLPTMAFAIVSATGEIYSCPLGPVLRPLVPGLAALTFMI
jgi:hypothetical protein